MAKVVRADFTRKRAGGKPPKKAPVIIPAYRLKLKIPFSDPLIWREIQVPGTLKLSDMHHVIQVCMAWQDSATHQFLVGKIFYQPGFGIESMSRSPEYDEAKFRLWELEEPMQFIFTYLYDGGDGWEVELSIESIIDHPEKPLIPSVLDGQRNAPPEAVGDIHQFQALLGGAPQLDETLEVEGEPFVPAHFDCEELNQRLARLFSAES